MAQAKKKMKQAAAAIEQRIKSLLAFADRLEKEARGIADRIRNILKDFKDDPQPEVDPDPTPSNGEDPAAVDVDQDHDEKEGKSSKKK